jgi:N-sulfoglucosamine sulfohydrolase
MIPRCLFFLIPLVLLHAAGAADRPNLLWITAEDLSPALGCYGDPDAITPNLDAFAKEAVRYTNAFAAAPVCSPSRSHTGEARRGKKGSPSSP